jgi:ATP-dependent Clp protease adaptor protein ClpS
MAESESPVAVESPAPAPAKPRPKSKPDLKPLPPYHVVLLDDDHHTYAYVIEMLGVLFAHPTEAAFKLAEEVDAKGRVIVCTTHKEKAELKRDQIHAYGKDVRMATSAGSMSARIEPAMG